MPDKSEIPGHYLPMLASTAARPFNDPEWQWEVKWDRYRIMRYKSELHIKLHSGNNNEYTRRFQIIADELKK